MGVIAIIPARKDSKRLNCKNTKLLCGKPMIEYTFDVATKSRYIDTVIVSSDDNEVKKIYNNYRFNPSIVYDVFIRRPKNLRGDDVPMMDVVKHTIDNYKYLQEESNVFVILQPTSPLRTADDIDRCIDVFLSGLFSSVMTVTKAQSWHYKLNGAVYVLSKKMIDNNCLYDENTGLVIMPYERSIDVDYIEDFDLCEMIMETDKRC